MIEFHFPETKKYDNFTRQLEKSRQEAILAGLNAGIHPRVKFSSAINNQVGIANLIKAAKALAGSYRLHVSQEESKRIVSILSAPTIYRRRIIPSKPQRRKSKINTFKK